LIECFHLIKGKSVNRFAPVATALLAVITVPALAAEAPRMPMASLADVPVVQPAPYDTAAHGDAQVDAAFVRARKSGKRVLIDMGGNWCPDCIVLANVMQIPVLDRFLKAHFEVVLVDAGRFDRNMDIPARFGLGKPEGVPAVYVATPDGSLINGGHVVELDNDRTMTPQGIADWLASWAK
jgi:thiol-disulfide isomerase/thioredoxin